MKTGIVLLTRALNGVLATPAARSHGPTEGSGPPAFYAWHQNDRGWRYFQHVLNSRSGYPEVSFTVISHIATRIMGIEPDAPRRAITTLGRLPTEVAWAQLDHVPLGRRPGEGALPPFRLRRGCGGQVGHSLPSEGRAGLRGRYKVSNRFGSMSSCCARP